MVLKAIRFFYNQAYANYEITIKNLFNTQHPHTSASTPIVIVNSDIPNLNLLFSVPAKKIFIKKLRTTPT